VEPPDAQASWESLVAGGDGQERQRRLAYRFCPTPLKLLPPSEGRWERHRRPAPLYAAAAQRAVNHDGSVELLTHAPRPLIVPALVVAEVGHLLSDRLGVACRGCLRPLDRRRRAGRRAGAGYGVGGIAELTEQYAHLSLGIFDACASATRFSLPTRSSASANRSSSRRGPARSLTRCVGGASESRQPVSLVRSRSPSSGPPSKAASTPLTGKTFTSRSELPSRS
jgi:hypothetical protein